MQNGLLAKIANGVVQSLDHLAPSLVMNDSTESRSLKELFVLPQLYMASDQQVLSLESLKEDPRVVLVGSAGSGKTTLMKFLSVHYSASLLKTRHSGPVGVLLRARHLSASNHRPDFESSTTLLSFVAQVASDFAKEPVSIDDVIRCLDDGAMALFVDGFDEIGHSEAEFGNLFSKLGKRFPLTQIVIASRPTPVNFEGFNKYALAGLSSSGVRQLAHKFAPDCRQADAFTKEVIEVVGGLAENPLMLTLLWSIFRFKGTLRISVAELMGDLVNYLMTRWNRPNGSGHFPLTLGNRVEILERIALDIHRRGVVSLSLDSLEGLVQQCFKRKVLKKADRKAIIHSYLSEGLLAMDSPESVSFRHLLLMEYFAARAVCRSPKHVASVIASRDRGRNIVLLSCEMLDDIAPIIDQAMQQNEVLLAARCLSHGKTSNEDLLRELVALFSDEVGRSFLDLLISEHLPTGDRVPASEQLKPQENHTLSALWKNLSESSLTAQQKGKAFEELVSQLLSRVFRIYGRNIFTENGEFDIVLETPESEIFWSEYSRHIAVECKNWSTRTKLAEVGTFCHKVGMMRDVRLGFIVSAGGFTKDAIRALRNHACSANNVLVVPISGDDIHRLIDEGVDFGKMLKQHVVDFKLLRKY